MQVDFYKLIQDQLKMTKKHQKESSQSAPFKELMADVRPMHNDRIDLFAHPENPRPYKDKNDYTDTNKPSSISDQRETQPVSAEESIFFAHPGLQLKTQKKLRQGKIPIDDHLDLHGFNIDEAREILLEFIEFAQQQKTRCVLLVHGKGYRANSDQPVLKNKVNNWLRQHPAILGFSSAQAKDGGTGAVYILIATAR